MILGGTLMIEKGDHVALKKKNYSVDIVITLVPILLWNI